MLKVYIFGGDFSMRPTALVEMTSGVSGVPVGFPNVYGLGTLILKG